MFYITGDTHSDFSRFERFCEIVKPSLDDTMIILGDAGLNYYGKKKDAITKKYASSFPMTFLCIHGNHEKRPDTVKGYIIKEFCGGQVWYEPEYPNILFAKDGEIYQFDGMSCIVIGGAYSVDKQHRLSKGWPWFADEQPSEVIKRRVEAQLEKNDNKIDVVLSHTAPLKYEPREAFLSIIDQSTVDRSTETWLDNIEEKNEYNAWYCGHYHTSKNIDKICFMLEDIKALTG
jgi:3-oxoacid CoA-transferase subunit A